jgi:gas vesicle protein
MSRYDEEFAVSTVAPASSLVYFTVGLVAGAAIALLVAPATGRRIRHRAEDGSRCRRDGDARTLLGADVGAAVTVVAG